MRFAGRRRSLNAASILAVVLASSTLLFQSCRSCPDADGSELYWPPFPDPEGVVLYDPQTGDVTMPLWYWTDIANYVIEVEQNIVLLHPP